jgi:integrase
MAHVERRQQRRPDGTSGPVKWRARVRAPGGREYSKTFTRKIDADRWAVAQAVRKDSGTWVDPTGGQIKFSDFARQYLASKPGLKPKTKVSYESLLNACILPEFGNMTLSAVKPIAVDAWVRGLTERGLSHSRTRQAYGLLGAIFKRAVKLDLLVSSPCRVDRLPSHSTAEMRFLSSAEVQLLAEIIEPPYGAMVLVLAYTGIRLGEASALRREKCDLIRRRLLISESLAEVNGTIIFGPTKTHQQRSVVVPEFVSQVLDDHLKTNVDTGKDSLVFTSPDGRPLRPSNFRNRYWLPAVERAELTTPLRIHDLRHTYASLAARAGASTKDIQVQLGHKDPALTLRVYQHLFDDDRDALGDRLDEAYGQPKRPHLVLSRPERGLGASEDDAVDDSNVVRPAVFQAPPAV